MESRAKDVLLTLHFVRPLQVEMGALKPKTPGNSYWFQFMKCTYACRQCKEHQLYNQGQSFDKAHKMCIACIEPLPSLFLVPFFALIMDFFTLCLMFTRDRHAAEQAEDVPKQPSTLVLYEGGAHTAKVFQFLVQQLNAQVVYTFQTDKRYVELPVEFQL